MWPRRPQLWAATLCVALAIARDAWALSRAKAMANAAPYVNTSITVTLNNVDPAIAPCYSGQPKTKYGAKLQPGSYNGIPYSYGNNDNAAAVPGFLAEGLGAGSSDSLFFRNSSCVLNSITGIDCSRLLSRAWEIIPPISTTQLADNNGSIALGVGGAWAVKVGDAFNKRGSHVVLFTSTVSGGLFDSRECTGNVAYGRCVDRFERSYAGVEIQGYHPWVSVKLKDDPAADVVGFSVELAGDSAMARWLTLRERDTESFILCRGPTQDGPFSPVSDPIPAQGGPASGASYEYMDKSYPGGTIFYQLREIESNGRELLQGRAAPTRVRARAASGPGK